MNKHRYECRYSGQNKAMFIRFVNKGTISCYDGKFGHEFKSYEDRYMYIRAVMDIHGVNIILDQLSCLSKKNQALVWLAWGHKSGLIKSVGLGDYTWPKQNKG